MYYSVGNGYSREVSFFGTATYSWKGRYTINGTVRYEGSNRLGKATSARWLPTWNISGSWNMHEENFFKPLQPTFSHLTLKASYSLTADRGPSSITNSTSIFQARAYIREEARAQPRYRRWLPQQPHQRDLRRLSS